MKNNLLVVLAILTLSTTCSLFQKEKEDNTNRNLLLALAIQNSGASLGLLSCSNSFSGIACIPDSLTSSASTTVPKVVSGKAVTTGDTKYDNLPNIYKPVRDTLALNKEILNSIGTLIANLRSVSITSTVTGSTTSNSLKVKYKYSLSTKRTGGKHLEIWWDNEVAPYLSLKNMELDFVDGGDAGKVEGQIWVRGKNTNDSSLYIAYVQFNLDGAAKTRTSAVVLQNYHDTTRSTKEKMHFFVSEANGIAKLDGGFTVTNYPLVIGTDTYANSNRAYLYSAAGSSTRAALSIAFPLVTNNTTSVFENGNVANIAEIWTDWLLYHLNSKNQLTAVSALCGTTLSSPTSAHPTSNEGSDSSTLKSCFDKIIASGNTSVNNLYYIAAARNPAYYSHPGTTGSTATLQSIETAVDISYDTVKNALKSSVRTKSDTDYSADFTASAINSINILTGAGLSATQQWGDGGTGVNSTNGSSNNTAGF
jgi:hypothetical protein